jgi:predicted GNAT family N-acyltransferase
LPTRSTTNTTLLFVLVTLRHMEQGVCLATTDEEREDAFDVRHDVFVAEQGVDEDIEYDDREDVATHFVAYDDGDAIGAARLREPDPGVGKVERVAVRESRRGEGWGRRLMDAVEATARERDLETLVLHSQTHVEGFYSELGYRTTSDVFEEANIPHVEMEKSLTDSEQS